MKEAEIVINGKKLTEAESMTLRVALSHYIGEMGTPGALGTDEIGMSMASAYKQNSLNVLGKMING